MIRSNWLRATLAAVLSVAVFSAHAYLDVLEGAAEVSSLELKTSAQQTVYARACDECQMLTLSVGPQTMFYDGKRRVTLADVAQQQRGATVFFDPQTYKVMRIRFW